MRTRNLPGVFLHQAVVKAKARGLGPFPRTLPSCVQLVARPLGAAGTLYATFSTLPPAVRPPDARYKPLAPRRLRTQQQHPNRVGQNTTALPTTPSCGFRPKTELSTLCTKTFTKRQPPKLRNRNSRNPQNGLVSFHLPPILPDGPQARRKISRCTMGPDSPGTKYHRHISPHL